MVEASLGETQTSSDPWKRRTQRFWHRAAIVAAPALLAVCIGVVPDRPAEAKSPGETHCYKRVCHRVKTLAETRWWVGKTIKLVATHYDHPSVDRFNIGKYTSSGEEFDSNDPTRTSSSNFPDGTELLVWNPENGRAIHVRVNDFGPFHTDRHLDLTRAAAEELEMARQGVANLEVIVVAPPPAHEPRYKRGRRYAPTLGYLGILGKRQIDALADRLVANASLGRMASIDIQQFLWATRAADLAAPESVASFNLPGPRLATPSRAAVRLAAFQESDYASPPPPRYLWHAEDAFTPPDRIGPMQPASFVDARPLVASRRQIAPILETAGRFALGLEQSEKIGWRSPPSPLQVASARSLIPAKPVRLAALGVAPPLSQTSRIDEVAATDVESIRWSIPGLDTFMRFMTPVWGAKVTPPQALEAALAMLIVLLMSAWAMAYSMVTGHLPVLVSKRPRLMFRTGGPALVRPEHKALLRGRPAKPARHLVLVGATQRPSPLDTAAIEAVRPLPAALKRIPEPAPEPRSSIGSAMRFEGSLRSTGTVEVGGVVIGDICCNRLIVLPGGRIEGSIRALNVEIGGHVRGTIRAAHFAMLDGGDFEGDVYHKTVEVASGASMEATLTRLQQAAE